MARKKKQVSISGFLFFLVDDPDRLILGCDECEMWVLIPHLHWMVWIICWMDDPNRLILASDELGDCPFPFDGNKHLMEMLHIK